MEQMLEWFMSIKGNGILSVKMSNCNSFLLATPFVERFRTRVMILERLNPRDLPFKGISSQLNQQRRELEVAVRISPAPRRKNPGKSGWDHIA
jgi:hypothetical protein